MPAFFIYLGEKAGKPLLLAQILSYLCVIQIAFTMKHLFLLFILIFTTHYCHAQSEIKQDSIPFNLHEGTRSYGDFLMDMDLLMIKPLETPKSQLLLIEKTKDYNALFSLNPNATYSQGTASLFTPSFGMLGGTGSMHHMQMGSFKLNNGWRINTYGDYNADGYRVANPSALPWERNNFRGAFEMKSANGNFGIRLEVQQGRRSPF